MYSYLEQSLAKLNKDFILITTNFKPKNLLTIRFNYHIKACIQIRNTLF